MPVVVVAKAECGACGGEGEGVAGPSGDGLDRREPWDLGEFVHQFAVSQGGRAAPVCILFNSFK